jgi:hypothetical protein
VGKVIAEDDELLEFPDDLDEDDEATGVDDADELALSEIEDGPEEIGLDVETLEGEGSLANLLDEEDDDDADSVLDDEPLDLGSDLDDDDDEEGWTEGSEGAGAAWDDELLEGDEGEDVDDDDGGLEGVDDPLVDGIVDEDERTISITGDDDDREEGVLERLELDLG